MKPVRWLAWLACWMVALAQEEVDNEESRKVLGSSVVTSVSVIMDHGNGTKTYITDAAGQPLDQTEGAVGSPVDLLNPDRYEFYTFDETGDLVKRLMTLDQIKGLLAGGDGETLDGASSSPTFYHESLTSSHIDDTDLEPSTAQGVHEVVQSVQNVLRSELQASKTKTTSKPPLNIPDSISSWSMLFPAIIGDSSESLDDGSDTGNSVNEPIDAGDRLPAPSNQEKTEIKIAPAETTTTKQETSSMATEKPTAVPPIIHFLEIQSVPSPSKDPTKVPTNVKASTTPVTASTMKPTITTTDKPTSPVSAIQEMSASISSLLSQVTDNQTSADMMSSAEENKILVSSTPMSSTESAKHSSNSTDGMTSEKFPIVIIPVLKPESTNINEVTKKPSENLNKIDKPVSNMTKVNKPTNNMLPSTTEENVKQSTTQLSSKINDASVVTKKTTDPVVSMITTAKPTLSASKTSATENKIKSSTTTLTKQKIQATTPVVPSTIKKNNIKNQAAPSTIASVSSKKPVKQPTSANKTTQSSETLEAHGSEDILKIVPNKQAQTATVSNKIKNSTQTKTNVSSMSHAKPSSKPHKKVPTNKPHVEHSPDCGHSNKTPVASELKNKEKLEVAASSNINERVKPSKIKIPVLQEVKTVQKPSTSQTRPSSNKVRPSEEVKITTYKPSTSQPFTTKQSTSKISTTTERSHTEHKIASASQVHEVNSSLFDIKNHEVDFKSNKTAIKSTTKLPVLTSTESSVNFEGASSNNNETKIPAEVKTNEFSDSASTDNDTELIMHEHGPDCVHSKKPIHTSILDKIVDLANESAASSSEEVKIATTMVPTTEINTEPASSKEVTTEIPTEASTKMLDEELSTTTEQLEEMVTELPETTTLNMPDLVKEGISAVTNILLDVKPPLEPQLPLPTIPLSESASNIVSSPPVKGELKHASSFDDFEMTTTDFTEENTTDSSSSTSEKELLIYFTTTDPPLTETMPPTTESVLDERVNISVKSSEESTEQDGDVTTSLMEETTTELNEKTEQKELSESKIVSVAVNQTFPTKESKLSPENINETTEIPVLCNQTLTESNETEDFPIKVDLELNKTSSKDHLESAQSMISEINDTKAERISSSSTTPVVMIESTSKTSPKDENINVDFKTALKPEPPKFTQVKYPNIQNVFRPIQDVPVNAPPAVELHPAPHESMGLEATTAFLADDVRRFADLCNELAFRMWTSITGKGSVSSRSLVLSPFATTSILAMVFLGARGPTSGQMNDVLRLDDMVTFNPHQVLQNVTESVLNSRNYGVTTAAFVRELYSDKLKGKILDFYKERAQQYYDGHVEEIAFNNVGDILRRRTNLLVKRQTLGKVPEYLRGSNLSLRPPLAAFSANIFQTDCDLASTEGRDGEMYFVVRPSTRQRRLVPVPAAVWRTGFLAGFEPGLDATAVALGTDSVVSTILVLPGQQGQVAPGDGLARLEQRLIETSYRRGGWTRLLRSLLPRPGLELQVPRFSHRSVLNITSTLQRMGLKDLFNENRADLRGLNGLSNDLHLSDMVQVNTFSTCGDDTIGARHHIETYPVSPQRMGRDDPELYPRPEDLEDSEVSKIPLNLRPRQARLPDNPRLRFDRPFLYMVRHNPTGMILHMGRFNPRLLP